MKIDIKQNKRRDTERERERECACACRDDLNDLRRNHLRILFMFVFICVRTHCLLYAQIMLNSSVETYLYVSLLVLKIL